MNKIRSTQPESYSDRTRGAFGGSYAYTDRHPADRSKWPKRFGCGLVAVAMLAPLALASMLNEVASAEHRLVGLGCGPDRLTLTAMEEDHFPNCDTIDTPEKLCGADHTATECAAYLGDGW